MRNPLGNRTALAFSLIALICLLGREGESQTSNTRSSTASKSERTSQEDINWTWHRNDDDGDLRVSIRGKVAFADDYSDIKAISDGGYIRVKDERRGQAGRRFEASAEAGSIKRSYWMNGQLSNFDDDARKWLGRILDQTVRLGGYDAEARVRKILKERGTVGVLDEISHLKSDHIKRFYFNELFAQGQLNPQDARRAMSLAGTEIASDYEKAQLLVKMSDSYLVNDEMRTIYLEGVDTIDSDYERGRALAALLKKGELNNTGVLFAIKSTARMSSDYEQAQLLIKIASFDLDHTAQQAYLASVASIDSDYEKGRVLSALLKKGPGKDTLLFTLKSASTISSDYEKAQLLLKVAKSGSSDEAVRSALVEAAKTIGSEYERGRVLSAVFK